MVVVLPAPFGPRMPVTSPRAALSVSPSTAVVWPYRLTSPPIWTAGACGSVLTDASLRCGSLAAGAVLVLDYERATPVTAGIHEERHHGHCGRAHDGRAQGPGRACHHHDPHAVHGRGRGGQVRSSGHAHGDGA